MSPIVGGALAGAAPEELPPLYSRTAGTAAPELLPPVSSSSLSRISSASDRALLRVAAGTGWGGTEGQATTLNRIPGVERWR